jgi:hypothetical protein
MITRALFIASTVGVAMALAAPAQADGFSVGSFMLGNGGSSWVPKCQAPQVLTEIKDANGRLRWVCAAKQQASAGGNTTQTAQNAPR